MTTIIVFDRSVHMRTLAMIVVVLIVELTQAQVGLDSVRYILIDTSRVKWDRPTDVCGDGRAKLNSMYVLQEAVDHKEFTALLRRTMKSQRRYSRTTWWYYFRQNERRWARVEEFMSDHFVGTMELTDGAALVLKRAEQPTEQHNYRLFGEDHRYALIQIAPSLFKMLGVASYKLPPLN